MERKVPPIPIYTPLSEFCIKKLWKMGGMMFKLFASASLLALGFYHLICSFWHLMKTPQSFAAKPFYPFPSNPSHRLHNLPFFLLILSLLFAFLHQSLISFYSDPLVKGSTPVHRFSSLGFAAVLFLFILIAISIFLSESASFFPLSSDLLFALASAAFFLHYSAASSAASFQTSDLQAHCDSLSARISALCSLLCFLLACRPRLFVADAALARCHLPPGPLAAPDRTLTLRRRLHPRRLPPPAGRRQRSRRLHQV